MFIPTNKCSSHSSPKKILFVANGDYFTEKFYMGSFLVDLVFVVLSFFVFCCLNESYGVAEASLRLNAVS